MDNPSILVKKHDSHHHIYFNRPKEFNIINRTFLYEINKALDEAESDENCRSIVLEGSKDFFSVGLDFKEVFYDLAKMESNHELKKWAELFVNTLKRFTTIPKLVIAKVEGKAMGGGIGFIAASDLVIAGEHAKFNLSEALWGLIPAMISPFLMRRMGFQRTYAMTLSASTISAEEGYTFQLIDEISKSLDESVKKRVDDASRLDIETILNIKHYYKRFHEITPEIEAQSINEIIRLIRSKNVQEKIHNFIENKVLPWKKTTL